MNSCHIFCSYAVSDFTDTIFHGCKFRVSEPDISVFNLISSLLESIGPAKAFLLYGIVGVGGWLFLYFFLVETRGVPLEKISSKLDEYWLVPDWLARRKNLAYSSFENE